MTKTYGLKEGKPKLNTDATLARIYDCFVKQIMSKLSLLGSKIPTIVTPKQVAPGFKKIHVLF
jgi:hypothetical protein